MQHFISWDKNQIIDYEQKMPGLEPGIFCRYGLCRRGKAGWGEAPCPQGKVKHGEAVLVCAFGTNLRPTPLSTNLR